MIKKLLLPIFVLSTLTSFSQSYSFSSTSGTYSDLVGSTSLTNGTVWDDPTDTIPFGFNFQYFNSTLNQITLDGNWGYGGDLTNYITNGPSGIGELLTPYGADLIDFGYSSGNSASDISYLLSGNVGSQILKIEWNHVGFYEDDSDDGVCTDYVNFQLWFYEGSNNIEIHFGPNSITQVSLDFNGTTGPYIGLFPQYDFSMDSSLTNGYVLTGDPASPTMIDQDSVYVDYLNGITPNGTIYKFTKSSVPTSISEKDNEILIYPNPVKDIVTISGANNLVSRVKITNENGQLVREFPIFNSSLDLSGLESGFYFIKIKTLKGNEITKKIIKE